MSIETVRNIPEHLPPARLFLDDVDEITNILFEARKASGESALPVKYTVKGKFICDALSDLKTLGGAVTEFEVRVGNNRLSLSRYSSRCDMWGAPEIRLATYAKLLSVFETRKMKLKAVIQGFHWLVISIWVFIGAATGAALLVFCLLTLAAAGVAFGAPITELPVGRKLVIALASGSLFGISIATQHWLSKHSVVEFRYSHEDRSLYAALRASNPVVIAVVAAIAGAVVTVVVERLFKWLWP